MGRDNQSMVIQSILFDKEKWTLEKAKKWLKEHNYRNDKTDETDEYYRFRQRDPNDFVEDSFRTIDWGKGIKAIMGKLKEGKYKMNLEIKTDLQNLNPHGYGGLCSRSAKLLFDKQDKGIPTIATTSAPALVVDWKRWEIVREILPMQYVVLPDNDKTVLLDSHSAISVEKILGSAINWRTSANELLADIIISETEEKIAKKIEEGHIDSVSLGYETKKESTIEIPKGKEVIIDGIVYKNEYEDDYPFVIRTWWKVKELSLVPIGADDAAKLKRMSEENYIKNEGNKLLNKIEEILNDKISSIKLKEENKMPDQKSLDELKKQTAEQIREIGRSYWNGKFQKMADEAAMDLLLGKSDLTLEAFQAKLLDEVQKKGGDIYQTPLGFLGLNQSEQKRYSISRAIAAKLSGEKCEEFEISDQLAKQIGRSPQDERSFFIPFEIMMKHHPEFQKRAHSVTNLTEGGYLVATDLRSDLLVEVLRNDLVLGRLGATVITGLRDNFTIPKIVSGLTAYSVAENISATKSYIVVGQITASPKHVSAYTEYGRQLFYQSSVGIDTLLIKELNDVKNVKVDYLGINGSGSSNEPTGLLNTSGIAAPSLATNLTWSGILGVKKSIKKANALRPNMKWCQSTDVESKLMSTSKVTAQPVYLMDENGQMAGYSSETTNQVPDQVLIFGDWSELYMLFWGVDELLVNPYSQGSKGMVELNIFTMFDVLVRQTAAFAIADDVPIS